MRVNWTEVFKATGKEYGRIWPHFQKFVEDHPEWACSQSFHNYPPEILISFYLRPESLHPRRLTIPNPTRAAVLTDEEKMVPADFVAEVAGAMRARRVSRQDPSILDYELRVTYKDHLLHTARPGA